MYLYVIYAINYFQDQVDADDTLVGSLGTIGGVSGSSLDSVLEYRDLSAWRVSIPRLRTSTSGGKHCFVYVIDVQRIDIRAISGKYSQAYQVIM